MAAVCDVQNHFRDRRNPTKRNGQLVRELRKPNYRTASEFRLKLREQQMDEVQLVGMGSFFADVR